MTINKKTQVTLFMATALLAGCAGAPKQDAVTTQAQPAAAAGTQLVDVKAGTVGPLKLGMTPAEAITAFGAPETHYEDFLAWNGGKVTAKVVGGHLDSIRVSDRTYAIGGFHVGESLKSAQAAFPGGEFNGREEVPTYKLPTQGVHAWMEVTPSVDQEVLAVELSQGERPEGDEH